MGTRVRFATPEDLDWIVGQLKKFSEFYGTKLSLFGDEKNARSVMLTMMNDHVVIVAERENEGLVGLISGYITPHAFNPKIKVLAETLWWVAEEHRGSRAGLLLLDAFKNYGEEHANWITFALENKSPVKDKCLTKRGFQLQERSYLREVG